jgi:thiol-disulfide isomerase/thioredoxin
VGAIAAPLVAVLLLAGCAETPSIASAGGNKGYVSGAGVYKEFKPADRKSPVKFSSVTDAGDKVSSSQYLGEVYVLNFWFAGCGPCRVEAPRLEKVYKKYGGKTPFLGVNTYDQAAQSLTFAKRFKITYPSAIDVNTVSVQYAFSKYIPPNAVPTTLVIDRHGRVAARVTGVIEDPSILSSLIDTVVSEGK